MDFDVAVIGGGIQGAGVAQAAAAAGYTVVVFEQTGIASGTSSKSSKLIHGGLRYLESGQFKLVRKTLLERERLIQLAPGLVKPVPFYIPIYTQTTRKSWQIALGLFIYQVLGGFKKYTQFKRLNIHKTLPIKNLRMTNLSALYQYYDAQTDDALLTRAVIRSAESLGAELKCPVKVTSLDFESNAYRISVDNSNESVTARFVVNVAGPWVNQVLAKVNGTDVQTMDCDLVQGTHIILDVPAPEGVIYVEAPQDQRAVFIMPWKSKTLVGTTEKIYTGDPAKVVATADEIQYLKAVYLHYMLLDEVSIIDSFAGLRVLPRLATSFFSRPRDTVIHESADRLLSLYGGKLTSYRVTAEQVLDRIQRVLPLKTTQSISTKKITLA